ncbi:hypothetical protein QAD02_000400 [Eretmocerus hayati]|uniref:Uncharacterized protein n=1 Tax=Eretmocerus hayati TaxID=131215 RepID=A0ACC2NDH7_9HYME|nr:hypothetical protein QAD02_000400 [Eretmocerus hayati]
MKKFGGLRELANCFYDNNSKKSDISSNVCKIVAALYSGELDKGLKEVRFSNYCESTASKNFNLKMLPPTEGAVQQHSYRVYHQLQTRLGEGKKALDWGWSGSHYGLKPCMITNKKFLIPEDILRVFFCSCRSGCKNNTCGCRRRGLKCSNLCKICVGKDCSNCEIIDHDGDESDEDVNENGDDREHENDYDETINSVVNDFEPRCSTPIVDSSCTTNDRGYETFSGIGPESILLNESENAVDVGVGDDVGLSGEIERSRLFSDSTKKVKPK